MAISITEKHFYDHIKRKYFDPFSSVLSLKGRDGIEQVWDGERDNLIGLEFPVRLGATKGDLDLSATLHEMGHFTSLAENRIVRSGFGFNFGLIDLNFDQSHTPHKPHSAKTEAMAIAWEMILLRDEFGLTPDVKAEVSALCFATDFLYYEGKTDDEKLEWVAEKVVSYMRQFGDVANFDAIWNERCAKLPDLFRKESIRLSFGIGEPSEVIELPDFDDTWTMKMQHYCRDDVEEFHIEMLNSLNPYLCVVERFDTRARAERWIEEMKIFNGVADQPGLTR